VPRCRGVGWRGGRTARALRGCVPACRSYARQANIYVKEDLPPRPSACQRLPRAEQVRTLFCTD
jgi:hypothetical protein